MELNRALLKNVGKRNKEIPTTPYETYEERRIDAALDALAAENERTPRLPQHSYGYLDDVNDDTFLDTRYSDRFLLHPPSNAMTANTDHDDGTAEAKQKPFLFDHQQQSPSRQQQPLHQLQHDTDANEKVKHAEESSRQRTQQRQSPHHQRGFDADTLLQQLNWY